MRNVKTLVGAVVVSVLAGFGTINAGSNSGERATSNGAPQLAPGGGQLGSGERDDAQPMKIREVNYSRSTSGLKYASYFIGSGARADVGKTVEIHYTGWLVMGNRVESSRDLGKPLTFRVGSGSALRAFDEGVVGMRVGEKRQLVVPPELAYGSKGTTVVPPNATLIYQIELIDVSED